ncbi:DNA topoisomerase IV subunit A [Candidatus Woesearchaeota archaeon]|nr:DNA topoisomerase IV subunit A [Candidatus Woesearchaeota archaeon]
MAKSDKKIIKNFEEEARNVISAFEANKNPKITLPKRGLSNVYFDKKENMIKLGNKKQTRTFFNVSQAKKFMQMFLLAAEVKKLIKDDVTTSIRDLFYRTKHTIGDTKENTFDDQSESDPIIEDIEVAFDALREELHLFASSRGSLVGNITIEDAGDTINCRKLGSGGWAIPSICEDDIIKFKKSEAKFVLFIEKDAVWRRFNEDKFWKKHNCIILHGQGVPPRGVRRLLRRFMDELKLPIYVLVDNDPWGLYIYSVIKQGSINLAYESVRMAVPKAKFIGLSSFDKEKYKLPNAVTIKLSDADKKRIKEILKYPWFQKPKWQKELTHMLKEDVKLELEALSSKKIQFISETYVPDKIKKKDWLE